MSLTLALFVAAQVAPVTFRSPALPLDQLLTALSTKSGTIMRATGRIAEDVLVLSVKDIPLSDLQKRIAEVTTGVWKQDGDAFVLQRDEVAARKQDQEELSRLAERYAKAIAEFTKPLDDSGALNAAEAERRLKKLAELNDRVKQGVNAGAPVGVELGGTPQERLLARSLKVLNPGDLATLPNDSRTVFSTHPNRLQRPLPAGATRALETFASEYTVWQSIAERFKPPDDENLFVDFGYFGPMKTRPTKMLIIATKWGDGMAVSLELKVVGDKGQILSTSAAGLDATASIAGKEDQPQGSDSGKPIVLSKESLEIGVLRTGVSRSGGPDGPSASLRAKLMNPETADPLAFAPSEVLLGLAEAAGKNIVACVPDSAFDAVFSSSSITPNAIRLTLAATDAMQLREEDSWIIGSPVWPSRSRSMRVNRAALGQLVRELDRPGAGSLEPLSKFANNTSGSTPPNLVVGYVGMLHPAIASSLDSSSWELMRFYAGLTPAQKTGGERTRIPYSALDLRAKNALTRLIFFSANSMPMGAFQSAAMSEESGGEIETMAFESISSEPTEAMPNGLPDVTTLTLDRANGTVAVAASGAAYTADDLGTQLAMRERPELFPYISESPLPPKYVLTNRNSLLITLGFNMEPLASYMLNDFRRGDGRWLGVNELPEAFRTAMETARKDAREAFKSMPVTGVGTGTGSNIPPN